MAKHGGPGSDLRYPREVLEAEEFVEGEVVDGPLNLLLDPGMAVVDSEPGEEQGPEVTGYHEEKGYDRRVLENLCEIARELEDGFSAHSELLHMYADPSARGGDLAMEAYRQLEAVESLVTTGMPEEYR